MSERKMFSVQTKALGERMVETVISTPSMDREGDRIDVNGWRLENYRRNPVICWSHDVKQPPIARAVEIGVRDGALRSLDEFPPEGLYPLADTVHNLVRAGFINSKSVGFRPIRWERNETGGVDYFEQELLESSYVAVPANSEAIVVARSKSFDRAGLDAWLGRVASDGEARDAVAREHLMAVKTWLAPSPGAWGSDVALTLRDGGPTGIILRDAEPTIAKSRGGRLSCPGPTGIYGSDEPCPATPYQAVESCPAKECPLRGENVSAGIILTDPHRLDELATRWVVDEEKVRAAARAERPALESVVEDAVARSVREWNCKLTGRID